MDIITSITNEPRQEFNITLDNGNIVKIYLYYYQSQYSWYFDFEYNNYVSKGNKVVLSPNTLRHLRKKIPFGIGFIADTLAEPYSVNDFINDRVNMIFLNQEDVELMEEVAYGKI